MILLCEKNNSLGEIFNRRHNVILHRVARTINAWSIEKSRLL